MNNFNLASKWYVAFVFLAGMASLFLYAYYELLNQAESMPRYTLDRDASYPEGLFFLTMFLVIYAPEMLWFHKIWQAFPGYFNNSDMFLIK